MKICNETVKRLAIVKKEIDIYKTKSIGILLTGSLAYAPFFSITSTSDIDLVIVVKNIKDIISFLNLGELETSKLKKRFFEGYCIKREKEGIAISYHFLTVDAFDIITKCFVADIRVFRESAKNETYDLYGFERNIYKYTIKNVCLDEFQGGVRTIVPIGFIYKDRYFIGIHRDKILSNCQILHDTEDLLKNGIDKLWQNVIQNLCDESERLHGTLQEEQMTVLNTLAKKDKMSDEVIKMIEERSKQYVDKYKIQLQNINLF